MVSIIIINYNSEQYLKNCVESIIANTNGPFEIIVVDNNSSDMSLNYLFKTKTIAIRLIKNQENLGFAWACNQGLENARGEYLVTMNPDVLVPKNWLARLIWQLNNNANTLVIGPKGIGIGGRQSPGPLSFSSCLAAADRKFAQKYHQYSKRTKYLIGCLLLFDHRFLKKIGNFDENLSLGADDFDMSLRVRQAGYELRVAYDVLIKHFVHVSFKNSEPEKCQKMESESYHHFFQKWAKELGQFGWKRLFQDSSPIFPGEKPF
jgi:GT2 family glycosyltransferase